MVNWAFKETGAKNLFKAGGVALNSVANGRIIRETSFEQIYIQPASGDGGGAIGAALYTHHMVLGQPRSFVLEHAYWGEEHPAEIIESILQEKGIRYLRLDNEEKLIEQVINRLQKGQVVG